MPLCLLVTLGQVQVLREGNVVNVDVNPSPSPDFPLTSIAQCWWGCSPLREHGVQPGMQTEGYEHEHNTTVSNISLLVVANFYSLFGQTALLISITEQKREACAHRLEDVSASTANHGEPLRRTRPSSRVSWSHERDVP
jgi:hypothetical protein